MERLKECTWTLLGSAGVGAVAFPSLLAASQKYVFRPLRVSCSPKLHSSLLGLASVTVASFGASLAALKTVSVVQQLSSGSGLRLAPTRGDLLLSSMSSVVIFRALGGRYASVLPSNLMRPGAFAVEWLPAMREAAYATPKERQVVTSLGSRHGCHSCGKRDKVTFIADHQPPSKLLGNHKKRGMKAVEANPNLQRFYPQCVSCSHKQGGLLAAQNGISALKHPRAIVTHGNSLRLYHLFLPMPFFMTFTRAVRKSPEPSPAKSRRLDHKADQTSNEKKEEKKSQSSSKKEKVVPVEKTGSEKEVVEETSQKGKMPMDMWLDIEVMLNFPLFIMWRRLVQFLDSFQDSMVAFHVTLWAFIVIASLGTI